MTAGLYLWLKALHIIAIIAWMAGMLYLPRLFVYHADTQDAPGNTRFCVMERRLYALMSLAGAAAVLFAAIRRRKDAWPFSIVALVFISAFGTFAISFWPYMIPFVVTIDEAAAPHSSLAFMFWGAGVVIYPLMLIYTVISYRIFRGKIRSTAGHY